MLSLAICDSFGMRHDVSTNFFQNSEYELRDHCSNQQEGCP